VNSGNGKARRYKGLLLDFGNVIAKSFFETREALERLLKLPSGSLDWAGPFEPQSDPLWQQVLTGDLSERDYWGRRAAEVGKLIGQEWAIREFCARHAELPHDVTLRAEMLELIFDAKRAGLKFGILTNELALFHGHDWLATMPFADQVDGIVDASHTHILKPDPRAYELALKVLDLAANEVIFIDDQRRNVAGGEAVGMRSVHMDITNYRACVAEVRAELGL
jgi:putative hydrolase of the HAD superfamily